jgi:hypothetical protein
LFMVMAAMMAAGSAATSLPNAVVKTAKQAIRVAAQTCKDSGSDLWHAHLRGHSWDVWKERSDVPCARALQVQINALDGSNGGCIILALPEYDPVCKRRK